MSDREVLTGRAEVERVQYTQVNVKDVSRSVTVRNERHAKANHYIKESRPYFPNEKLPTYIDCPYFMQLAQALFGLSLLGALVAAGAPRALPMCCFAVCLLFIFFFCQHEWVSQKSLPVVFRQPVFGSQRTNNAFYEVTVTELDGVALQNYQAGVGFIQMSQGKIKFQAFNKTGVKHMSDARCHSRLTLLIFVMAAASNCYFMAFY